MSAAALAVSLAYAAGQLALRLGLYCGAAAWLLARAGQTVWRHGSTEFGRIVALIIAAPTFLRTALEALRGIVGGLFPKRSCPPATPPPAGCVRLPSRARCGAFPSACHLRCARRLSMSWR